MTTRLSFSPIHYGTCYRCGKPASILRTKLVTRKDGSQSATLKTCCRKHAVGCKPVAKAGA